MLGTSSNTKTSQTSSVLLFLSHSFGSSRPLERVSLGSLGLGHLFLFLLLQVLSDFFLSLSHAQGTIAPQVERASREEVTARAPDLLVFEQGWVEKLGVAADKRSCWRRVGDGGLGGFSILGLVPSEGSDNDFVGSARAFLRIVGCEVCDTGAAGEVHLGHVQGRGGAGRVADSGLGIGIAHGCPAFC